MAKDKASTRKPRRRNARARDDGGTRRATEATPPVRASKRLSVQISAAASAFLVNFRLRMDAIASIFVNYHEERRELVEKTEAADLIEQNIADEGGPATHQLVAATLLIQFVVLPRKMGTGRDSLEGVFLFATEAGAPAWLTLGFEHVGSSASLIHLRFDLLFKRDRGVLALRPRSRRRAAAARWTALKIFSDSAGLYPMERVAEYGEKQVVRLAKEAANAAARPRPNDDEVPPRLDGRAGARLARGAVAAARLVGPGAGGAVAVGARDARRRRRQAPRAVAAEAAGPRGRAAGAGAAPPRRRVKKRVVDDADADDEDEAWEPGRPSMMDLDDDEQEQAAKAKRKLKRRSKKKSAKAKNAAGAAPHAPLHEAVTQEQERNAFLERIQAEEVRREQARIAGARPVPPPPNRATGAGDDSDEGWEESDEDDPVEDLIHRERIRERDLLRTPGCLALGRKAFRLEDMPRVTERDREILRRVLYILREAERFCAGVRSARVAPSPADLGPSTRAIASFDASRVLRGDFDAFAGATAASSRSRGRGSGRSPTSATR
ncbi:hypothetical protein JL720_10045 [Aureococcus anophagefferens]|nr:hypothetical protein JL720_10045 [Aureococcus anophagefferens]